MENRQIHFHKFPFSPSLFTESVEHATNKMDIIGIKNLSPTFPDDEPRRHPAQRPTTAMLGNEVLNKEQLYDLFQQILGVKKFEHQLLYNAMQASHTFVIELGMLTSFLT